MFYNATGRTGLDIPPGEVADAAPLLPAGTTLVIAAWHDNTAENPNNPDHEQWVDYGDRTVNEMAHLWVDVTYLDPAEFEALVAAREAARRAAEAQTNNSNP